ncbi:amastin, putative [Bodo saltans]|uniref:Amastin, putative n=1 Tax=Bodo saltans TaxID=75058 RepID=A0A0S4JGG4_BODSA|nr:amastin, putative [Bodo saltans]|eukprot:CUG89223.1 amastin, putative [Bodo saltans]
MMNESTTSLNPSSGVANMSQLQRQQLQHQRNNGQEALSSSQIVDRGDGTNAGGRLSSTQRSVQERLQQWAPQTSTFSKPFLRLPAYRGESGLMLFAMVVVFVFEISAAVTPVFLMKQSSVGSDGTSASTEITVYHNKLRLCLLPSTGFTLETFSAPSIASSSYGCSDEDFPGRLCDAMTSRLEAAQGFAVVAILIALIGIINCIFEFRGTAFMTPLLTYVLSGFLWWMLFLHFVLDSAVYEEKLCRGRSLKSLGFSYRSGWVLGFVSWLWLSLCVLVYFIRRRTMPFKYIFEEPTPVRQQQQQQQPQYQQQQQPVSQV